MPQPPNCKRTYAVHDKFCHLCVNFKADLCEKHQVPVVFYYTCDDWERDWEAPEKP
jgi:hypothetical protein